MQEESLNVLEVGVFEISGVFEAETEQAVEADVGGPDEGDGKELWFYGEVGDGEQDGWSEVGVGKIIKGGTEVDVREIAEHEEVWREQEDGEEEPAGVELVVEENAQRENDCAFEMEEDSGFGEHWKF